MVAAKLDEKKIKPTSTAVDGAQSQQRLGKQAKAIMDEFVKALDKVGDISGEVGLEREEATRAARAEKCSKEFVQRMLKNAPKSSEGQILAERKSW